MLSSVAAIATLCRPEALRAQAPKDEVLELPALKPLEGDEQVSYTKGDLDELARTESPPLLESLGVRVGMNFQGLVGSKQGRPLLYPDISLRRKAGSVYFDLRLPALLLGFDFGQRWIRRERLSSPEANMIFEILNKPAQYVQAEAALGRLGYSWTLQRPASIDRAAGRPFELTVGAAALGDWVIFEARLFSEPIPEDVSIGDYIISDPIVIGAGGFLALSQRRENFHVDLALMVARDLFQWQAYTSLSGFLFSPDLEVVIELAENFAMSTRVRATLYTHAKNPRAYSVQTALGVIMSF